MKNKRDKIMVIEPNIKDRVTICNWLSKVGFSVYECRDNYNSIHLIRKVKPVITLLNVNTKDIKTIIDIVETDRLSKIIFISDISNLQLEKYQVRSHLKTVIKKPLEQYQVIECLKKSLQMTKKGNLETQVAIDQERIEIINRAKKVLMNEMGYSEEQAYIFLRKNSMDHCKSMVVISEIILKSFAGK